MRHGEIRNKRPSALMRLNPRIAGTPEISVAAWVAVTRESDSYLPCCATIHA